MQIYTERLVLRPLEISDLNTTHEYAADFENTRYMLFLPNKTLEESRQYLAWAASEWEKAEPVNLEFAITLGGKHIGAISIHLDKQSSTGEFGWILNKKYWGYGFMTEAALAVKEFAVNRLKVIKLIAHCESKNKASQNVMKKIGMRMESFNERRQYPDSRGISGEYTYTLQIE